MDVSVQRIVDFAGESNLSTVYKDATQRACFLAVVERRGIVGWPGSTCCFDSDAKNVLGDLISESIKTSGITSRCYH